MGDYDEMFDKNEAEAENNEQEENDKTVMQYQEINPIIDERNKILHRLMTLKEEYNETIGRLQLYLFGDKKNDEYQGKIEQLEEEISNPMTKTHPMAPLAREVIRLVLDIQMLYKKLNNLHADSTSNIGVLLDNCINLYNKTLKEKDDEIQKLKDDIEAYKIKVDAEDELKTADRKITQTMVNELLRDGGKELIDKYRESVEKKDRMGALTSKSLFVRKAKEFFINKHPDPRRIASMVFDTLTIAVNDSLLFVKKEKKTLTIVGQDWEEPILNSKNGLGVIEEEQDCDAQTEEEVHENTQIDIKQT